MSFDVPDLTNMGLDLDIKIDPIKLDKISVDPIKIEPLHLSMDPLKIDPLELSLRLTEVPSIRAHLPVNYKVGFALFGMEFFSLRLCGEAQAITEPYHPNPCEHPLPPALDIPSVREDVLTTRPA